MRGCLKNAKFHPGLHERWTYVDTDDFLRTRISWMHRQPHFLTHGAPLCARELCYDHKLTLKYLYSAEINSTGDILLELGWEQPAKTAVSPNSLPLGVFCQEGCLHLCDRNSKLMISINVYIIKCLIFGFSWSIFRKFCVLLLTLKCFF